MFRKAGRKMVNCTRPAARAAARAAAREPG